MKISNTEQRRRDRKKEYWAEYRAQAPRSCRWFIHDWFLENGYTQFCLKCGKLHDAYGLFCGRRRWLDVDERERRVERANKVPEPPRSRWYVYGILKNGKHSNVVVHSMEDLPDASTYAEAVVTCHNDPVYADTTWIVDNDMWKQVVERP